MLAPGSRQIYLDALRPPTNFSLDRAVGTTYSLNLETLLSVPLGFAMLDWENKRGALTRDPVALLHALRQCADRVTVFCQASRIASPAKHHPLFAYLEPMVVEANAPDNRGQFHAKTWLLRFTDETQKVMYRFICLSRNLTPDRSWDTILTLDGELADRERAIGRNRPLGDFVAALPGLAQTELTPARREAMTLMADEVRRVKFDLPEPFEEIVFWPMGLARRSPFPLDARVDRLLVISPFLSDGFLRRVASLGADTLISRSDSLELVSPEVLNRFKMVHVLDDAATEEDGDSEGNGLVTEHAEVASARGLHAKLFVADQGWGASIWTGSANATDAAFERNVEFMVQMLGKKGRVGIDAFMNGVAGGGFGALLQPFAISERRIPDPEVEANEERAESFRRYLARAGLRLRVDRAPGDTFDLVLRTSGITAPETSEIETRWWPATVSRSMAQDLDGLWHDREVRFSGVTVQTLTSFVGFEVIAGKGEKSICVRFTLNLPLEGAPENRMERVLQAVLGDRDRLLRYLLFLLARNDDIAAIGALLADGGDGDQAVGQSNGASLPLFEELLRALARSPDRLIAISRLIEDLKRTQEGASLLPDGFDEMWKAIWTARAALAKETHG